MKFEYEVKQDNRECVAYIDDDGDLVVKNDGGACVIVGDSYCCEFTFHPSRNDHKFYPGDKVTITF